MRTAWNGRSSSRRLADAAYILVAMLLVQVQGFASPAAATLSSPRDRPPAPSAPFARPMPTPRQHSLVRLPAQPPLPGLLAQIPGLDVAQTFVTSNVQATRSVVTSSLQSGPYGILALASVASLVVLPITQIKSLYGFSIGYGTTVGVIGLVLRGVFQPARGSMGDQLALATIFFGFRLAAYLALRDITGWKPNRERKELKRLQRVSFAISLALFYAFETAPLLYALRSPVAESATTLSSKIVKFGVGLAWFGAVLEALADAQKFIVKTFHHERHSHEFFGPTWWCFWFTRHPNYTGEVLFWLGLFIAGAPSFGTKLPAALLPWVCSSAGLLGLINVMVKASNGLEKRQSEKYGGDIRFRRWKKRTPWHLFPLIK